MKTLVGCGVTDIQTDRRTDKGTDDDMTCSLQHLRTKYITLWGVKHCFI